MTTHHLTRTQLHQAVWTHPLSTLAPRFGISDVGLKKICDRHDIPTPARGFWAKRRAGKRPRATPLPAPNLRVTITITPTIKRPPRIEIIPPDAPTIPPISVRRSTRNLHPEATDVLDTLRAATSNHYGKLECLGRHPIYVRVSNAQISRAAFLVDALLTTAAKMGYTVQDRRRAHDAYRPSRRVLLVEDVEMVFKLTEPCLRSPHTPTAAELRAQRQYSWKTPPAFDYTPTGKLSLTLATGPYLSDAATWRDRAELPLEQQLPEVFERMLIEVENERQARRRKREAEEERQRERQRLEEHRRELARIEARRKELWEMASAWRQSNDVRAFLEAVETVLRSEGEGHLDRESARWLDWARSTVEAADPLTRIRDVISRSDDRQRV